MFAKKLIVVIVIKIVLGSGVVNASRSCTESHGHFQLQLAHDSR